MTGDRYCVNCGDDLGRVYDPPIRCDSCWTLDSVQPQIDKLTQERDEALARVAALEAVLAEPSEEEAARLAKIGWEAWASGVPGVPFVTAARAILADLRQQAGVVERDAEAPVRHCPPEGCPDYGGDCRFDDCSGFKP